MVVAGAEAGEKLVGLQCIEGLWTHLPSIQKTNNIVPILLGLHIQSSKSCSLPIHYLPSSLLLSSCKYTINNLKIS
jgi:hypothetical protein